VCDTSGSHSGEYVDGCLYVIGHHHPDVPSSDYSSYISCSNILKISFLYVTELTVVHVAYITVAGAAI
jgi:hypothetical protein